MDGQGRPSHTGPAARPVPAHTPHRAGTGRKPQPPPPVSNSSVSLKVRALGPVHLQTCWQILESHAPFSPADLEGQRSLHKASRDPDEARAGQSALDLGFATMVLGTHACSQWFYCSFSSRKHFHFAGSCKLSTKESTGRSLAGVLEQACQGGIVPCSQCPGNGEKAGRAWQVQGKLHPASSFTGLTIGERTLVGCSNHNGEVLFWCFLWQHLGSSEIDVQTS